MSTKNTSNLSVKKFPKWLAFILLITPLLSSIAYDIATYKDPNDIRPVPEFRYEVKPLTENQYYFEIVKAKLGLTNEWFNKSR